MIEFYKEFGELGYLANYSNHGFTKNGVFYKTVEHYYQSEKFSDPEIKKRIIDADTPKEASNIGRDRSLKRIDDFKSIKNQVMFDGILEKFRQHRDIAYKLIETRNRGIAEATVDEYYWGIGKDKSGKNVIGDILVKVRERIKKEIEQGLLAKGDNSPYVIAIDGMSASGKTTLGKLLHDEFPDSNLFHIDVYFLQAHQKTPERLAEVGGNVDYERFREEVMIPLKAGKSFAYRPFSCKTFTLSEPVAVMPKQLNIVEGTYCMHPYFGDVYDLKLYLSIDPDLQKMRIYQRPQHVQERFFTDWIPMEKRYFDFCQIPEQADIQVDMTHRECGGL